MGQHFQRGQVLFALKRYPEAIAAFQDELGHNPNSAFAYALIAAALVNLRHIGEADGALQRALELEPQMAYAHYILSFIHQRRGRLGAAERAVAESVRLGQTSDAFHQWAFIAEQRGRYPEALAAADKALELNPLHNPSLLLKGSLLAKSGRSQEAQAVFVTALANDPQDASAQHAVGAFDLRKGNADAALDKLREARRLDPIRKNDAEAIALAYGRSKWPLRIVDSLIIRPDRWSPRQRWALFTAIAASIVVVKAVLGLHGKPKEELNPAWLLTCIAAANYAALPYSFDRIAKSTGVFFLHREFALPWYEVLRIPFVAIPIVFIHVMASLGGLIIGALPAFGLLACLFGVCYPLLSASLLRGELRLISFVCLPLMFIVMLAGTIIIGVAEYSAPLVGGIVLMILFAACYWIDPLAERIVSWRLRRSPLLRETSR